MTGSRPKKAPAEAGAGELRAVALRLLGRREYAVAELGQRLLRRGYPQAVVDPVLAALQEEGLLDEARFAESFIASRRARGDGPLKLRRALQERGVADPVIHRYLDAPEEGWLEQLEAVRRKRFGAGRPDSYAEWARQARFLRRRGFTSDQIRRVLRDEDS